MVRKVKAFVNHAMLVPGEWCDAVGIATHHRQVTVLAYAESKAALAEHYRAVTGDGERAAEWFVGSLTLPSKRTSTQYGYDLEAFMAEVPPDEHGPGIFLTRMHALSEVWRADTDGGFTLMGEGVRGPNREVRFVARSTRQ